jgi:hypothetical protein
MQDDENPADTIDIGNDGYTELEWCLIATAQAINADIYQFRVTKNPNVLDTYTLTPQWTIGTAAAGPTQVQLEGYHRGIGRGFARGAA